MRKRGFPTWFKPGGKPEPGESLEQALRREVREELATEIGPLTHMGRFVTQAANEPGHTLIADMFLGDLLGEPLPSAEISELAWKSRDELREGPTAPLILDYLL